LANTALCRGNRLNGKKTDRPRDSPTTEESIRRSLFRLLSAAGFAVRTFCSAEKFREACTHRLAGCLLLDIIMPGCSGLELQEDLRQAGISLPIIFLTGSEEASSSVRALKFGAVDFLAKPVAKQELVAAINKAFAQDNTARQQEDIL